MAGASQAGGDSLASAAGARQAGGDATASAAAAGGDAPGSVAATNAALEDGALERLLDRTAWRLGFGARLARAAWLGLAAVVAVELGALAARGVGSTALVVGEVSGALLGVATVAALARGKRPTRVAAARAIDRRLGRGALVETAAEALAGRHGAFAVLAVSEARHQSVGVIPADVAPLETPRGLWFGGGAALLLLALALGPASEAPVETGELPVVFDAAPATGVGTPKSGESPRPSPTGNALVVKPAAPGGHPPGASPPPRLSPEQAQRIIDGLRKLGPQLASRPPSAAKPGEDAATKTGLEDLDKAIAAGDAKAAETALERIRQHGSAADAAALDERAKRLEGDSRRAGEVAARPGDGGAGTGPSAPTPGPTASAIAGSPPAEGAGANGRAARPLASWRIDAAAKRYRQALEESRGGS